MDCVNSFLGYFFSLHPNKRCGKKWTIGCNLWANIGHVLIEALKGGVSSLFSPFFISLVPFLSNLGAFLAFRRYNFPSAWMEYEWRFSFIFLVILVSVVYGISLYVTIFWISCYRCLYSGTFEVLIQPIFFR